MACFPTVLADGEPWQKGNAAAHLLWSPPHFSDLLFSATLRPRRTSHMSRWKQMGDCLRGGGTPTSHLLETLMAGPRPASTLVLPHQAGVAGAHQTNMSASSAPGQVRAAQKGGWLKGQQNAPRTCLSQWLRLTRPHALDEGFMLTSIMRWRDLLVFSR